MNNIFFKSKLMNTLNDEIIQETEKKLYEKYFVEFITLQIGDRWNTDYTKLYLKVKETPNLLITAFLDKKTRKVKDDYLRKKYQYCIEERIKQEFKTYGLDSVCYVSAIVDSQVFKEENEINDYSLIENRVLHFNIDIILEKSQIQFKKIKKTITYFYEYSLMINKELFISFYIMKDNFDKYVERSQMIPGFNLTWLKKQNIEHQFIFSTYNKQKEAVFCELNTLFEGRI